jgi:hypothetical protein
MVPRRIYVSAPGDSTLNDHYLSVKKHVLQRLKAAKYEPQQFAVSGLPKNMSWTFQNADEVMRACQGAIILAFPRIVLSDGENSYAFPTEYNHFEGALAVAHRVPRLILVAEEILGRGIADRSGGDLLVMVPRSPGWLKDSKLNDRFNDWRDHIEVQQRDVFLAYCGKAKATADALHNYLRDKLNVTVRNWAMDFHTGSTILEEVQRAAEDCRCGIFLFTKDDPLEGAEPGKAAPRDNVVFEAGFFMSLRGKERTLVIREQGAKMPADLGGIIYASLEDRDKISTIDTTLREFLEGRL